MVDYCAAKLTLSIFMKAIIITQPGPPEVLQLQEIESPSPSENQVLIKVKAAGVNAPDIYQRKGKYPARPECLPTFRDWKSPAS
jgi:NADPH:quinone reductase